MREFATWRGFVPEAQILPTVRAEFVPNEYVFPRYRLEVDGPGFRLLQQLVERAITSCEINGDAPSDQLVALHEALEAMDD